MNAKEFFLLRDIINPNGRLFTIPVYQRNYDWSEEHCKRLLDDLERIITKRQQKHFLGSIVYLTSNSGGMFQNFTVIDGQQRLTTVMILLKALHEYARTMGDSNTMNYIDGILFNSNFPEARLKLKASVSDYKNFAALLENRPEEINRSSRILINYETCLNQIDKWAIAGITPDKILNALHFIQVVSVTLTQEDDDPQMIFESINSTGLDLSNADLIRNFLLMSEPEQERLFKEYWLPIERNLKEGNDYTNLDNFFMHYMVFRTNSPAESEKYLYRNFTDFFRQQNYTHEQILQELKPLSEIYMSFIKPGSKKYPPRVMRCLEGLRTLKQTTCYPFLLHVFDDYEHDVIDVETLHKVTRFMLGYILRRVVCRVTSNTLRGFSASLYSRIFKIAGNKSKYYEAVNKFISTSQTKDGLPSDADFLKALTDSNIYKLLLVCRFILTEIENGGSKEILRTDNLSIEHIMPQNLTQEWEEMTTPEEHERWVHTLGNLTLTASNSELSDKNFHDKKEILSESKAVKLNSDVINKDSWTIQDIRQRGERLADVIMKRFKTEKINDPDLVFEPLTKIDLDDSAPDKVTNTWLEAFVFDGEEYRQSYFALMLVDVVRLLDGIKPDTLGQLADRDYSFKTGSRIYITKNPQAVNIMKTPREIRDGIFIDISMSAKNVVQFITDLFRKYGVSLSRFYIMVNTKGKRKEQ